jgi:uncharacterized membrane protein
MVWGLAPQGLTPLISAIPCLLLNILADHESQKDLIRHYSLPILSFLMVAVIANLAAGRVWLQQKRAIILWSLVGFLALAKIPFISSKQMWYSDTLQATREAIALVQTQGSVLTTYNIAPHLAHRPLIKLTDATAPPVDLNVFDYVLLNLRHHFSTQEFANSLANQLKNSQNFNLKYQRDDVYLFEKNKQI